MYIKLNISFIELTHKIQQSLFMLRFFLLCQKSQKFWQKRLRHLYIKNPTIFLSLSFPTVYIKAKAKEKEKAD